MNRITELIRQDSEFTQFLSCMKETIGLSDRLPIAINGLSGGAETAFIVEAVREAVFLSGGAVLVLTESEAELDRLTSALLDGGIRARGYKRRDLVFHNIRASHDVERERLSVLSALLSGDVDAVVSTPSAAAQRIIPRNIFDSLASEIRLGDFISPEELSRRLVSLGYRAVDTVESQGQFSRRGGIVDFFGGETDYPVRIEFFGDEIDRLSFFDPISQRTISLSGCVRLLPAVEVLMSEEARSGILKYVDKLISKCDDTEAKARLNRERAVLSSDATVDFRDKYLGLIYSDTASLFSYLGDNSAIFVINTNGCNENLKKYINYLKNEKQTLQNDGIKDDKCTKYTLTEEEYRVSLSRGLLIHTNSFAGGLGASKLSGLFGFRSRRCVSYGGNFTMLLEDIRSLIKSMYRIVLLCESEQGARSLIDSLAEADISASFAPDMSGIRLDGGKIYVTLGDFEGFELISPKVAVLSMSRESGAAVMKHRRRQRVARKIGGATKRLMSYADLSYGDYVVHANYGIGLFEGIETVTVDGITKDYITIKYAGTDKLFVPCDRLEMIGKYIGEKDKDGGVKLSKMGGTEWHRTKSRAKAAAKDIAKGLIALYAERQRKPGFAFPEDSDLEDSFALSFDFEETESQAVAISEIKADMMRPVPMNRLLCGDVGFGKTEVALRAAFKAIMGGKQVAILVPTTILAMQHYQTAISRMRSYPVTIEMLTRFKTPKQQAEIIRKVKRGETDILIGTHKLLSKKIEFSDLGLLIVDEEQRFGVSQKEKLKEMARSVDVLTLTATPIPRTLNMAMNGISDISILDEAPEDRRPVQTYVMEQDDGIIYDAIRRELSRGGQVLYLYNKVESIDLVASRLMHDLPDARVAVAHGQMDKDELEDVWQMLIVGEIDILVCTTIVETGIDLPNANTLIIENADRFGLSQLHQLRGRVGRSERQAYAYFTYRPGKALSEVADKRLSAIKEYAEFGAGFKIALCDLEIRGAGNLLGAEQHGYIDSVGYDLYVKLLNEAVLEEKGELKPDRTETVIDMRISAHIPESYIPTSAGRMEMYKKISLIRTPEDESDILDEFIDRYGSMPRSVERLLEVALMKAVAEQMGISRIEAKGDNMTFHLTHPDLALWSEVFSSYKGMRFAPTGDRVVYRFSSNEPSKVGCAIMRELYRAKEE